MATYDIFKSAKIKTVKRPYLYLHTHLYYIEIIFLYKTEALYAYL